MMKKNPLKHYWCIE